MEDTSGEELQGERKVHFGIALTFTHIQFKNESNFVRADQIIRFERKRQTSSVCESLHTLTANYRAHICIQKQQHRYKHKQQQQRYNSIL